MASEQSSERGPMTLAHALGFGIGDFFGGGQMVVIATYTSLFWTRFCGMDISRAQMIIGAGSIVSAFAALMSGLLSDNFYRFRIGRRFGRRRFFLLLISPLLLVGILLWIPGLTVMAYAGVFMLWVVLAQMFQACYTPLAGEMTEDFTERTMLSTSRLFVSTAAGTVLPLMCSLLLSVFGESTPIGYQIFTIGATILFSLAVFLCWRFTWELTPEQAGFLWTTERALSGNRENGAVVFVRRLTKIAREYASTLRISLFRRHLYIYLLVQMSMDIFGQTFVYFVIVDWNRSAAFASLLLGCTAVSLPLMPLFGRLINDIGPRRLYRVNFAGCLVGVAGLAFCWFLVGRVADFWWTVLAVIVTLWFFSFKSLCGYIPWAVFPFIADVDQIVTGRYRSATFAGVQAFFRQACSGVATIAVGMALGLVRFDSTRASQPESAHIGVGFILLGWFGLSMVLSWIISTGIGIDKNSDHVVLSEVARVSAGGSTQQVTTEVRRTIESLTGIPYGRGDEMKKGANL